MEADDEDLSDEELSSGDEGATTNPKITGSKDQIDRRRERNRVLARKTRLRKKSFFESLQRQVAQLSMENDMLKGIVKHREVKDQQCATETNPTAKVMTNKITSPFAYTNNKADLELMATIHAAQRSYIISDPALPDNPIIFASEGFLELSGYPLEEVLGRNCRFMQGPGTDLSQVDVLRKGILAGEDTSVCLLNYRADGTQFYNQIFVSALRDANQKVINYVGVQVEIKTPLEPKHPDDEDLLGLGKAVKKGRPRTRELKEKVNNGKGKSSSSLVSSQPAINHINNSHALPKAMDIDHSSSSSSSSCCSRDEESYDSRPPKKSPRRSSSSSMMPFRSDMDGMYLTNLINPLSNWFQPTNHPSLLLSLSLSLPNPFIPIHFYYTSWLRATRKEHHSFFVLRSYFRFSRIVGDVSTRVSYGSIARNRRCEHRPNKCPYLLLTLLLTVLLTFTRSVARN